MFKNLIQFFRDSSLVFKLSMSILLSVVVGSVLLGIFVSNYSKPLLKEQVISEAYKSLGEVNYDLAQGANIVEQSLVNTANILAQNDNLSDRELLILSQAALESIEKQYGFFYEFWIYVQPKQSNELGVLYYSYIKNGKLLTTKWENPDFVKDREWYKSAIKQGAIHWTEPYMSIDPNDNYLLSASVSIPFKFKNSKNWNGVIAASGNLEAFRERMSEYNATSRGKFLLISSKGIYLIHPNKDIEMNKTIYDLAKDARMKPLEQAAYEMKKGESGFMVMTKSSIFKGDVVFVYMPVPKTNWGSFLVYSSDNFYKPVRNFQIILIAVTMLGVLCLILLINRICELTTSPLVRLAHIADHYGKGEFSVELPKVTSNDEVGVLTNAFYNMRDNLLNLMKIQKENAVKEQKMVSEMEISTKIQKASLPVDYPSSDDFSMWAYMNPAKEVGGDFYDFFYIDEKHFAFLIADASGKGIPAALFMMNAKTLLKSNLKSNSLKEAVEKTNNELCKTNNVKMFITAFIGILNTEDGTFEYVNAGHNPPLLRVNDKYSYLYSNPNIVLSAIENFEYETSSIKLEPNEGIFLYTDGVVEAQNTNNEFYSYQRLEEYLNKYSSSTPQELLLKIKESIDEFTSNASQFDDITMLNLIYKG